MLAAKERPRTIAAKSNTEQEIVADPSKNNSDYADLQRIIRFIHNEEGTQAQSTKEWIEGSEERRDELKQLRRMNREKMYSSAAEQIKDFEKIVDRLISRFKTLH